MLWFLGSILLVSACREASSSSPINHQTFYAIDECSKHRAFPGSADRAFDVLTAGECVYACLYDDACMSVNYCQRRQKGKTCELNHHRASGRCDRLTERKNCHYYEMRGNPCLNGGNLVGRQCVCVGGHGGQLCDRYIKDCSEAYQHGSRKDGIYKIQPFNSSKIYDVYCSMKNGGLTVFQQRASWDCEREDFFRSWDDYKLGFGAYDCDFWLGNDLLHKITRQGAYDLELLIGPYHAVYNNFAIDGEQDRFRIHYTTFQADSKELRNGFSPEKSSKDINGQPFSTPDQDSRGCALRSRSGWWFGKGCAAFNLNVPTGLYKQFYPLSVPLSWPVASHIVQMNYSMMAVRAVPSY